MSWLRSHLRLGSWSVLLALTMQLAVSFGHQHIDRVGRPSTPAMRASAIQTSAVDLRDSPAPTPRRPVGLPGDFCAICLAINLIGPAVPSSPPALPLPLIFSQVLPDAIAETPPATSPSPYCQPRAPPQTWA
jgi:hypothetical protein